MTRLYVPTLNEQFTLTADWTFDLYRERRNLSLFDYFGIDPNQPVGTNYYDYWTGTVAPVTIPKGTVMCIERYYIKRGAKAYDSITFRAWLGKKSCRFWSKLNDANKIEAEFQNDVP